MHARSAERGRHAQQNVPGAEHVIVGDLSDIEQTKDVAYAANAWGQFDAVIHNAGVYRPPAQEVYAVNVIAPYILTCLIQRPTRLLYLSSGLHLHGHANLETFKRDSSRISYSDSKLYVVMLCMAAARKWPDVYANAAGEISRPLSRPYGHSFPRIGRTMLGATASGLFAPADVYTGRAAPAPKVCACAI